MTVPEAPAASVSTYAAPGQAAMRILPNTARMRHIPGRAESGSSPPPSEADLESLKIAAVLINYWKEFGDSAVVIGRPLAAVLRLGFQAIRWAWSTIEDRSRRNREAPRLRFVQDERQSRWSVARLGSTAGTHVHGHWYVTNTSDRNVRPLKARLHKDGTDFRNVFTRHPDQNVFGRYPIEPHAVSEVVADFTFYPPICHDREPLITNVIFTDNYGDEHPLRSVRFRYVGQ